MSTILGGGEVPVKAGMIPADNAVPIAINFADERGVVTGVVVGGLTKRQELAGRCLAAMMAKAYQPDGESATRLHDTVDRALQLADALLAATEPKT